MNQTPANVTSYNWKPVKKFSKNSKIQKNKTYMPAAQNSSSNILSPSMELEKTNSKMSDEECFPSTQAFTTDLNVKEGIGWDYKSPSTIRSKTEMQKILEESDSPKLTMKPKPSTSYNLAPPWKGEFSNRQLSSPVTIDMEGLNLLNDLKVMADRAKKNDESIQENEVSTTDSSSPLMISGFESKADSILKLKEFNPDDDSFLLAAVQDDFEIEPPKDFNSDDDSILLAAAPDDFEIEPPKNFDSDEDSFLLAAAQEDFEILPGPSTKQNYRRLLPDENKPFKQPAVAGSIHVGNKNSSETVFDDDGDIDGK